MPYERCVPRLKIQVERGIRLTRASGVGSIRERC